MIRRVGATAALITTLLLTGLVAPADAGTTYYGSFRQAARALVVAPENSSGYDRDKYFGDWKDLNGDCQNTRAEVLIQESTVRPTFSSSSRGCTVATGRWVTSFDNKVHTSASTVQIDHMVPVNEAWGSGAKNWTQKRRTDFYNDFGDSRSLNAQTSSLNASKGARSPNEWMPPTNGCSYVARWVVVKMRWGMTVDQAEKDFLVRYADGCPTNNLVINRR